MVPARANASLSVTSSGYQNPGRSDAVIEELT